LRVEDDEHGGEEIVYVLEDTFVDRSVIKRRDGPVRETGGVLARRTEHPCCRPAN
jgi:hypothetical protein